MFCLGLGFTFVYSVGLLKKNKSPFAPGKHIIGFEELKFFTQASNFLNKYFVYFGKHQDLNGNPSTSIKSSATRSCFSPMSPPGPILLFSSVLALLLLAITSLTYRASENQAYSTDVSLCSIKRE